MHEVTLTGVELFQAAAAGSMRYIRAMQRGRVQKYGDVATNRWATDIEGCCGELAFAKYANLHWSGGSHLQAKPGDVGDYEVRTSTYPSAHLLVHPDDSDEATFVLVTGAAPTYNIVGSIKGSLAKREIWWHDGECNHRPSYWVPQSELEGFGEQ